MSFVKVIIFVASLSFYSSHVSVDRTVAVRLCWTEANSARYTNPILRIVCLHVLRQFHRLHFV